MSAIDAITERFNAGEIGTGDYAEAVYADKLDRLLAFGDLIETSQGLTLDDAAVVLWARRDGFLVAANPANSNTLLKLTEAGRLFIAKWLHGVEVTHA